MTYPNAARCGRGSADEARIGGQRAPRPALRPDSGSSKGIGSPDCAFGAPSTDSTVFGWQRAGVVRIASGFRLIRAGSVTSWSETRLGSTVLARSGQNRAGSDAFWATGPRAACAPQRGAGRGCSTNPTSAVFLRAPAARGRSDCIASGVTLFHRNPHLTSGTTLAERDTAAQAKASL